ncbi:MAG: glycosyltransferase [Candidatus Bathyarchaeota archaeon]|nr:glycosyltransferase [Candidatus Bathyarchaeum sp.]
MSIQSFDIVMWAKDGAWVLPTTLRRLEQVLPNKLVHRKIMVDDRSTDETREIAKSFGWEVYTNPESGISSGANFALSMVDCPYFMSVEQDLLLSKNWWNQVSPLLNDDKIGTASGVRFSSKPQAVHDLEKFVYRKYLVDKNIASYLSNRKLSSLTLGKTLDNTMYKTDIVRAAGGFPYMASGNCGIDTILVFQLLKHGYEWKVNPLCQSVHLRRGFQQILNHQKWYAVASQEITIKLEQLGFSTNKLRYGPKHSLNRLLMSPFVGVFISAKMRNPLICIVHPLIKLYNFMGYVS